MIAAYLGALIAGAVSAFSPVTPVEPYLIGVMSTTGCEPVPLGLAAAVGQTAGKLVLLLVVRGTLRSAWLRRRSAATARRLNRRRASRTGRPVGSGRVTAALRGMTTLLDRRWLRAPIVFASAVTGVPPLLATTVYAARTPMPAPAFALVCLLGRSIRFVAIATAPQLLR